MIGINIFQWLKILYKVGFNIKISQIPKVLLITFLNIVLYPFIKFERWRYRNQIWQTEIVEDPIFIIGHWRSGTTHLHKMLTLDQQFAFISLTETSFPHLLINSSKILSTLMRPITPKRRATDNVEMFPEMPHEHEFALLFLSLYSPLLGISFPDKYDEYSKYITFEDAPEQEVEEWKKWFLYLVKKLTLKNKGKQLVLKNPLDTCRINLILDIFPNAKFVHLKRNPYDLFYSTVKLHKHNSKIYNLQKPTYNLEQLILDNYNTMYEKYYQDVSSIPKGNHVNIRFEELKENPIEQLKKIYQSLGLENYENALRQVTPYINSVADYKPSTYEVSKKDKHRIYSYWRKTFDKWGYEKTLDGT